MPVGNKCGTICIAFVGLSILLLMSFTLINILVNLAMEDEIPLVILLIFGLLLCIVIAVSVFIITWLVALSKGKSIFSKSIFRPSNQHQLARIDLRAGPAPAPASAPAPAPNYGPQMTTYGPTSNTEGQLAPMVICPGPIPNNQRSGSNPNLGPYFGSNTASNLEPPSGPDIKLSRSDSNLKGKSQFGPNVPQFSGPPSGPSSNQFSGPQSGPYNNEFSTPRRGSYNNQISGPSSGPYNNEFSTPRRGSYNNQISGPSSGPYNNEFSTPRRGSYNNQISGPPSGPYNNEFSTPRRGSYNNQISGPSSGPYNNEFSGPPSGPYNNQFLRPMGPSPGPYNPNMGPTHDNALSPSAPPIPRDFDMNPPRYDDYSMKK